LIELFLLSSPFARKLYHYMANFVETPRQFNPYIQQIPIDAYVAAGMQRQSLYDQGVQKVSGFLDSLSGLSVARDVDSQYLHGRISDLTQRINEVAGADWSNQAIVSQVGKLAGVIANDDVVKNAVIGTKKYLKDEADIADAKKNGKWAPENEWLLRKEMSSWMSAPQAGAIYNSNGYKPYVDVASEVIKSWKDAHPDSTLTQRPNGDFYAYTTVNNERVGIDGRTLIETSIKELRPDEIASEINSLLTGAQREQLAITGLYQHRNINDVQGLNKLVDDHYRKSENYFQKLLDNENLELSLQKGDAKKTAAIKDRIAEIEKKRSEVLASKKTLKEGGAGNPDALKSSLYYEDWINGVSEMLGYSENSTKIVDNPSYKAMLEEFKVWADLQKAQISASARISARSSRKKGGSSDDDEEEEGWSAVTATVLPLNEDARSKINLTSFSGRLAALGNQMDQSMLQLLYRQFGDSYVTRTVKDLNGDGISEDVYSLKKERQKDAALAQAQWWDAYRKGDTNLDIAIRETLRDNDEKRLVSTKLASVLSTLDAKGNEYVQTSSRYQEYKKAESIFNRQPTVNMYGVNISPADIKAYRQLIEKTAIPTGSPGVGAPGGVEVPEPDNETLQKSGLSAAKYQVLKRADAHSSDPEFKHYDHMLGLYRKMKLPEQDVLRQKDSYINDEIKKYAGIFNEVALTLPSAKPEQVRPIANFVATLAANARETEMGGSTNWKSVREMIGEEHVKETAYSYVQDGSGNVRIRISNPDVNKGTPQEIMVDSQTAKINNFSVPDYLSSTRSMLELGENIRTGTSFEQSIPTNNQLTGKYNVRHEVENFNGRYKVKLYITEPGAPVKELPINTVLFSDWSQLTNFLQQDVTEKFISSLLGVEQKSPSGTTSSSFSFQSSIFSSNPLIQP
jgi:hypothetical protein